MSGHIAFNSFSGRRLKWVVAVLALSNVLVGIFSVYALRQEDRRYSALISRSVPVLNDLQTLTNTAAQAMVVTNPTRVGTHGTTAIRSAIDADTALRRQVLTEPWLSNDHTDRPKIKAAGDAFMTDAIKVERLIDAGRTADAIHERETVLLPAFSTYLETITKAADVLEAESDERNAAESHHTSAVANLVLGVAGLPILVVTALLVLTFIFVGLIVLLFRSVGADM